MRATQRKNIRGESMSGVDIAEVVILVIVFSIGVGGFVYAATKED